MKIRTDFVTNSSSSSFTLVIKFELNNGKSVEFNARGGTDEIGRTDYFGGEAYVKVSPKELGSAQNIDELIKMLEDGVLDECYDEDEDDMVKVKIFDKSRPEQSDLYSGIFDAYDFIEDIRKNITSIDQIEEITVSGRESNYCTTYDRVYSYDTKIKEYYGKQTGEETEVNGCHGGYLDLSDLETCDISYVPDLDDPDAEYEDYEEYEERHPYKPVVPNYYHNAEKYVDSTNNVAIWDTVFIGTYEQNGKKSDGKEDIEWIVLDVKEGKALVLSRYALCSKPYNSVKEKVTWETCTLRKWLNEDFLKDAFTEKEIDSIFPVYVKGNAVDSDTIGEDKIFVLSEDDVINYLKSERRKSCREASGFFTEWWIRSGKKTKQDEAPAVDGCGYDVWYWDVFTDSVAVRPAMWIKLDNRAVPEKTEKE